MQISINECRNVVNLWAHFPLWLLSRRRCVLEAQQLDVKIQLRGAQMQKLCYSMASQIFSLSHNFIIYDFFLLLLLFPFSRRCSEHPKRWRWLMEPKPNRRFSLKRQIILMPFSGDKLFFGNCWKYFSEGVEIIKFILMHGVDYVGWLGSDLC